jgi:hypothetical protein
MLDQSLKTNRKTNQLKQRSDKAKEKFDIGEKAEEPEDDTQASWMGDVGKAGAAMLATRALQKRPRAQSQRNQSGYLKLSRG